MRGIDRQIWVTGIGLLSSIGEDVASHQSLFDSGAVAVGSIDEGTFAPYPVHRITNVDFGRQIPKTSEQRQMGAWQRIGVYAAGMALADAGVAGRAELLERMDLVVAAGNGERDVSLDESIVSTSAGDAHQGAALNLALSRGLRPTLYLGELSNLLAGNIQIVHHVTGSSRTFKGEEICGVSALENAVRRIGSGQGELFLVGGALNAERWDLLLNFELGCNLWHHPFQPVWQRGQAGGGFVPGSMGAFLVLESRAHAQARGARPYARIAGIASDRSRRGPGEAREALSRLFEGITQQQAPGPLPVFSGASGVEPVTREELDFLYGLEGEGFHPAIRGYGSRLGHGVEAHFPMGVALAALSLRQGRLIGPCEASDLEEPFEGAPTRILVTCAGHWRGEGLALIESAGSEGGA